MSPLDDYEDEMSSLSELSDRDLDRLLAGREPVDPRLGDLAAQLRAAKAALQEAPDDDLRCRHLAALVEAARAIPLSEARSERPAPRIDGRTVMSRTKSLALKLAAATVAATMTVAGLAYAGVNLPGTAAERAFESVAGVELPNQDAGDADGAGTSEGVEQSGKSVSDAVHEARDATEPGCERGRAVSEAASANRQSDVDRPENDPCTASENAGAGADRTDSSAQGSRATGEQRSADGRARAARSSGGASEAGADNAGTNDDAGRARAEEASSGRSAAGGTSASEGRPDPAGSASEAGADNAGTHDDAGRAGAEEASGGRSGGNPNRP